MSQRILTNTIRSKQRKNSSSFGRLASSSNSLFWFAVSWISISSAYDAFLVYKYREGVDELNPICNWLLQLAPDSAIVFLIGKTAGTIAVVSVLCVLYKFWLPAAKTAAFSVAFFQVGLMGFLHLSEPDSFTVRMSKIEARRRAAAEGDSVAAGQLAAVAAASARERRVALNLNTRRPKERKLDTDLVGKGGGNYRNYSSRRNRRARQMRLQHAPNSEFIQGAKRFRR